VSGKLKGTVRQRFLTKVDKTSSPKGCWLWTGSTRGKSGYGGFCFYLGGRKIEATASRLAWFLEYGPIPKGMHVCHDCDEPSCVRPGHLFLSTALGNRRDCMAKNRQARGEQCGRVKLTVSQVRQIKKSSLRPRRLLAEKMGINLQTLQSVDSGRNWGWLNCGS
jgi:hypothetical protein